MRRNEEKAEVSTEPNAPMSRSTRHAQNSGMTVLPASEPTKDR